MIKVDIIFQIRTFLHFKPKKELNLDTKIKKKGVVYNGMEN